MLGFAKRNPASSAISLCFVNKGMMTTPPESDRRVLWGFTYTQTFTPGKSLFRREKKATGVWLVAGGRQLGWAPLHESRLF